MWARIVTEAMGQRFLLWVLVAWFAIAIALSAISILMWRLAHLLLA